RRRVRGTRARSRSRPRCSHTSARPWASPARSRTYVVTDQRELLDASASELGCRRIDLGADQQHPRVFSLSAMGHIHAESPSEAETDQRSARLGVDVLSKACFDEFPPSRSEPREALDRGSFVREERAVSRADLGEDYINVYSLA